MCQLSLDYNAVKALLPHEGHAVLIDEVIRYDANYIECSSRFHQLKAHTLMIAGQWPSYICIEAATQAMCLHGLLVQSNVNHLVKSSGTQAAYIGKISKTTFNCPTLNDYRDSPLMIIASIARRNEENVEYDFNVMCEGDKLSSGKALSILYPL